MDSTTKSHISQAISAGNYDEASFLIEGLVSEHPKDVDSDIWYWKGLFHQNNDQFTEAISAYNNCIGLDPKYAEAITNKGICVYRTDQGEDAFNLFCEAVRINPSLAPAWIYIGLCYIDLFWSSEPGTGIRDLSKTKSVSAFRRAVAVDPQSVDCAFTMAVLGQTTVGEWIGRNSDEPEIDTEDLLDYWGFNEYL